MRLTVLTDYALRLLIQVAQTPERLCTIAEIAAAHGISESHLMKVTHLLAQHGWIQTLRGKGGGMRLAMPPSQINLGEVVRSMETDFFLVECFSTGSTCVLTNRCQLAGALDGALQAFFSHLDGFTLADILPRPAKAPPGRVVRVPVRSRSAT